MKFCHEETQHISFTSVICLILFWEIIAIYSESWKSNETYKIFTVGKLQS